MFPSDDELLKMYADVLDDPEVRAVGGWSCQNHDDPMDEAAYVDKALSDLDAFSAKVDEVLPLLS